jgi:hypothetical protein
MNRLRVQACVQAILRPWRSCDGECDGSVPGA